MPPVTYESIRSWDAIIRERYGTWAWGWIWCYHSGGPIGHWASGPSSVTTPDETTERAVSALLEWREWLERTARRFAELAPPAAARASAPALAVRHGYQPDQPAWAGLKPMPVQGPGPGPGPRRPRRAAGRPGRGPGGGADRTPRAGGGAGRAARSARGRAGSGGLGRSQLRSGGTGPRVSRGHGQTRGRTGLAASCEDSTVLPRIHQVIPRHARINHATAKQSHDRPDNSRQRRRHGLSVGQFTERTVPPSTRIVAPVT
ncbi:hypothetical protein SUDANB178_00184 [Streptomyces sp. enrichment culture]